MKNTFLVGPLLIIFAAFLWSLDGLLRRDLYTLPASVLVFYEHFLGTLVLLPAFAREYKKLKVFTKKDWIYLGFIAVFSGTLATIFYTKALGAVSFIQYSVVVLLTQLQPLFAVTAAVLILKERISRKYLVWALLALIGAYFATFPNLTVNLSTGSGTVLAAGFALLAAAIWGTSTAVSRGVLLRQPLLITTMMRFILTTPIALLVVFSLGDTPSLFQLTPEQFLRLIGVVFSAGLVALLIYYAGLKRTPARISTICELFWPVSALGIGYLYFGERFTSTQLIGVILVLLSIVQVSLLMKKKENI